MSQYNKKTTPDNDKTGEIISWVIVFILMFAFPPVGILMLLIKLRGYAKPANATSRQAGQHTSAGAYRYSTQSNAGNNAYRYSTAHNTGNATYHYSTSQSDGNTAHQYSASTGDGSSAQQSTEPQNGRSTTQQHSTTTGDGNTNQQNATVQDAVNSARQAAASAWQAGTASRQAVAKQVETSVRDAVREVEAVVREITADFGSLSRGTKPQSYVRQPPPKSYNEMVRETVVYPKKEMQKKKKRTQLEKKSGKFVATIILLLSIALFVLGGVTLIGVVQNLPPEGLGGWAELSLGVFYMLAGLIAFLTRNIGVKRLARYKKYYAIVTGQDIVPISEIAIVSGQSGRVVKRDIQVMINEGYLGAEAYIDNELESLVFSSEAANALRRAVMAEAEIPEETDEKPENQYMAIITELRELNDTIVDVEISDKIDRIEEVTAKIFRIVEENPEKLSQIRRFMSYYLPTTLKLLRSYAMLEKQGIQGDNITAAKENIGKVLDTLAIGFEQQLDQLFEADAMDIAADINVLENLMQQDGLTGEKSEFKTMEGT